MCVEPFPYVFDSFVYRIFHYIDPIAENFVDSCRPQCPKNPRSQWPVAILDGGRQVSCFDSLSSDGRFATWRELTSVSNEAKSHTCFAKRQ